MDEILNLYIEISTELQVMFKYWNGVKPARLKKFCPSVKQLTDFNKLLDKAWDKEKEILTSVIPVEDEKYY